MNGAPRHLLIVGDSVALGVTEMVSDEIRGMAACSFVQRLRTQATGWRIDVDAAAHRTTTDTAPLLADLLARYRPDVVLLVLGGNDADINWRRFILTGGRRVRPNVLPIEFEQNLRRLIAQARAAGATIVLSDLPEHDLSERARRMSAETDQDVVAMIASAGGQSTSDRHHGEFADLIDRVARDTAVPVARWAGRIRDLPASQRCGPDGIHPSEAAHVLIAEVVADVLDREIRGGPAVLAAAGS